MRGDPGSPEEAAAEMVNGRRLLPGEPPDSNYAEDARYWTKVYQELIDTKRGVLEETRRPLPALEERSAHRFELVGSNERVVLHGMDISEEAFKGASGKDGSRASGIPEHIHHLHCCRGRMRGRQGVSGETRSSPSITMNGSLPTSSLAHKMAWPNPRGSDCRTEV